MKKIKADPKKILKINKEVLTSLKKEGMMKLMANSICPATDRLCSNGHCTPMSGTI